MQALVNSHVVALGLQHAVDAEWAAEPRDDLPWPAIATSRSEDGRRSAVMQTDDGALVVCRFARGSVTCDVHARTPDAAHTLLTEVRRLLPALNKVDTGTILVTFWSNGRSGPTAVRRRISAPRWPDIDGNYHQNTRRQLADLMGRRPTIADGKLVLWHGAPGTGKTWAARALGREWSGWASTHYVTDPEQFFGASVDYMLHVILDRDEDADDDEAESATRAGDWRLLVMEDTGELLTMDARQSVGQGLSRLLNVCDGLIGQGLPLIVLITTNEDLGVLHPAVTRSGRSLANIRFDALDANEAAQWALAHNKPWLAGETVLADLFAGDAERVPRRRPRIGFRVDRDSA